MKIKGLAAPLLVLAAAASAQLPLNQSPTFQALQSRVSTTEASISSLGVRASALDGSKAPLASPALTGIPTAPTAAQGANSAQIATTAYADAAAGAAIPANTILSKSLAADVAGAGSAAKTIILSSAQTLAANLTIPANVRLQVQNGGSIVSAGYTLAINGGFSAPPGAQVFYGFGAGQVTIAPTATSTCYAEWWGASTSAPVGAANDVPINSAMAACHDVTSLAGVYYTSAPIRIAGNNIKWHGQGVDSAPRGTRISINSATADCVDIGPASYTRGNFGSYAYDDYVSDIACYRAVPASPPPSGNAVLGAAGFSTKGAIRTNFTRTQAVDDVNGYYAIDTVNLAYNLANADRADSSSDPTHDQFYGFYTDGVGSACTSGCTSLNASTLFNQVVVSAGGAITPKAVGMDFPGSFSDQQLIQPNISSVLNGIIFAGPTAYGLTNTRTVIDVQVVEPIIDGIASGGSAITVSATNPYGAISIVGGYGAWASGANSGALVNIVNARGVTIAGGFQFVGYPADSGATCLAVQSSAQIAVDGLWQDCGAPVVATGPSSGLNITGSIYNDTRPTGLTAVSLAGVINSRFSLTIDGKATGQFAVGIAADAASTHNYFNVASVGAGPVTSAVNDNGVVPTADGYIGSTSNLMVGIGR